MARAKAQTQSTKRAKTVTAFTARVERMGGWFIVSVPAAVSRAFGKRGHVAVVAHVNGVEVHRSLIPRGGGKHFLTLNASVRRRAAATVGSRVKVTIALDKAPPDAAIPGDLAFVLREEDALAAFQKLSRSHRNHIIEWIDQAVMEPTRERRIARAVEVALARREKTIDEATER
jgi:hypothetical protein